MVRRMMTTMTEHSRRGATAALLVAAMALPRGPAAAQETEDTGPEPTVWGTVEYFGTALLTDAWAVLTSPTRIDGNEGWILGGSLALGGLMFAYDEEIWEEALRSREKAVPAATEDLALLLEPFALMSQTNKYYAGALVLSNVLDHTTGIDQPRHIFEELLISHWVAAATRKTLGRAVGRLRPDQGRGAYWFNFYRATSFPSGHVSTAAQVATVLSHHIDWWPASVLLYGSAAAVAYERVLSSNHWASDSFLGAMWGWGVAKLVIERREADRQDWMPLFDPSTGAVGFSMPLGF